MTDMRILTLAIAALLPVVAACGDDDDDGGTAPATDFAALLTGDEEVPPVPTTTATGAATLSVEGDQITYTVEVTDLQNAVAAHIHIGAEGENGPIRMNLCGTPQPPCVSGTGVLATGTNGTTVGGISFDSLVSAMRTAGAYVNVHTDDGEGAQDTGPGDMVSGEIRGQVLAE
jgi:hypothetical protein